MSSKKVETASIYSAHFIQIKKVTNFGVHLYTKNPFLAVFPGFLRVFEGRTCVFSVGFWCLGALRGCLVVWLVDWLPGQNSRGKLCINFVNFPGFLSCLG